MAKKTDTKEVAVVEVLDVTNLRELAKGEQGQYIKLVDIEETKTKLQNIAKKYDGLVVTRENYKKEGALAEKELRQNRYALQRIHKGNNKFINDAKKTEKELYDELISLIKPQEDRIAKDVEAFKEIEKREKEAEKKKEEQRIKKIEDTLKETEFALEKSIIKGKTDDDLKAYDKFLEDFKEQFKEFDEFEFQAKRVHAIYTARRGELVKQIADFKKLEQDKKEQEEKDKKKAEQEIKILGMRKNALVKKGFELKENTIEREGSDKLKYTEVFIKSLDEVQWFELLETIDEEIKKEIAEAERKTKELKKKEEQAKKDALIKARKDWDDLVEVYKKLGGDAKLWKLRKNEIPNEGEIKRLAKATRELHDEKKALKLKGVSNDLAPFKNEIQTYLAGFSGKIKETKFENEESRAILNNFVSKVNELFTEVFSEV